MKVDVLRAGPAAVPLSRAWARFSLRSLLALCLFALAVGAGYVTYARLAVSPAPVVAGQVVTVGKGSIVASVSAVGSVVTSTSAKLGFRTSGRLAELAVTQGQTVSKGDVLARLDPTELVLQVAQAKAQSASAEAKLAAIKAGPKPGDVAQAQALLDSAQAKLAQVKAGATAADLAAAEAAAMSSRMNYDNALANLRKVQSGATQADLAAAQASVEVAQVNYDNALANQRKVGAGATASDVAAAEASGMGAQSQLSSAEQKLADLLAQPKAEDIRSAEIAVNQAKNSLWSAQLNRDGTCGNPKNPQYQCDAGNAQVGNAAEAVNQAQLKLDSAHTPATPESIQAARDAVASAKANLDSANSKLALVKVGPTEDDLGAANNSIASAKANLDSANARLAQVSAGSTAEDLATARNNVASAKANMDGASAKLAQTKAGPTAEELTITQASVVQTQNQLDQQRNPTTEADLRAAEATVEQAKVALQTAQLNLDNATLVAPFDGAVASVSSSPGELVSGNIITLVDPKALRVEVSLAETDVAKVEVGQLVALTFDALSGQSLQGRVAAIAPMATVQSGVATYLVSLNIETASQARQGPPAGASLQSGQGISDAGAAQRRNAGGAPAANGVPGAQAAADATKVRPGMTASASITVSRKDNVLVVPNRAVKTQGRERVVEVMVDGKAGPRVVTVGASNDSFTEIVQGLQEGEQVLIPTTTTTTSSNNRNSSVGGVPSLGIPGAGGSPR